MNMTEIVVLQGKRWDKVEGLKGDMEKKMKFLNILLILCTTFTLWDENAKSFN